MNTSRWLGLLLVVVLAGCDETRFAVDLAPPATCEVDLRGVWRIVDDNNSAPEYVQIADQCKVRLLLAPKAGEGGIDRGNPRSIVLRPNFVRVDRKVIVSLTDEDFHRADGDEDGDYGHSMDPEGFHLFQLDVRGERMKLHGVDHAAVARAIVDDKLRGDLHKTRDGLKNLVTIEPDALRKLVGQRWLFRREDPLVLERTPLAELPPALRRAVERGGANMP